MPIYEFKCTQCKKSTELILNFSDFQAADHNQCIGTCKKCKALLYKQNQQINFAGGINMNASAMGINQRTFNNKKGGPAGIVGNKNIGRTGL